MKYIILLLFSTALFAQPQYSTTTEPKIGDTTISCVGYKNKPVVFIVDYLLPDIGMAVVSANGIPLILINPNITIQLSDFENQFWLFHECAHHELDHVFSPPTKEKEREADCRSIINMKQRNLIKVKELESFYTWMKDSLRGDETHDIGSIRVENIKNCLNNEAENGM